MGNQPFRHVRHSLTYYETVMDEATAVRVFVTFNICEGILWLTFAAGFAVVFLRRRQRPALMLAGGLLFLSFGLSDFVETQTGGWYKPWWMLAWKGVTLAGLLTVCVRLQRNRPKRQGKRRHQP